MALTSLRQKAMNDGTGGGRQIETSQPQGQQDGQTPSGDITAHDQALIIRFLPHKEFPLEAVTRNCILMAVF